MTVLRTLVLGLVCVRLAEGQDGRHEFTAVHMGVPVRIVLHASSDSQARWAARGAFARIAELDEQMSDYRPRSEVRRLAGRPREWQPVSPDLARVMARAQEVSRLSDGAFDVTVGPLVQLWRESRRSGRLPDSAALGRARSRVGWHLLEVDSTRSAVRLWADSMQIDLGGIAKGYILSEALEELRVRGVPAAMVEAGGDLVLGSAPPGRAGWSVEIAGADSATRAHAQSLVDVAVATSGATEQFVEIAGVRYSHVVDPRTGLGVTSARQVTVVSREGTVADALATALSVLGPERAKPVLARFGGKVERVVWVNWAHRSPWERELPGGLPP